MAKEAKLQREVRRLLCVLTDTERMSRAMDHARVSQAKSQLEADKKSVNAGFKARLDELSAQDARLSLAVSDGKELRDIECEIVPDYKAGRIRVVRLDDDAVIEDRVMSDYERQEKIEGVEPPAEPKPAPKRKRSPKKGGRK